MTIPKTTLKIGLYVNFFSSPSFQKSPFLAKIDGNVKTRMVKIADFSVKGDVGSKTT
jgi:hypothetical protein